jgi:FKBP-type peptidyl-prolyl cis-trans isomerase 2
VARNAVTGTDPAVRFFFPNEDSMIISEGKTVAITYTLTLDNGEVVDSNVDAEPLTYTQGEEQLIFGLEQALAGKRAGETFAVSIQPEEGYGPVIEEALIEVPLDHLPEDGRQAGAMITAVGPQGQELQGMITAIKETTATLDFNHPLAGQVLHFDVTILSVE